MLATVPAVAVKLAAIAPAVTVTDAGIGRAALFEESPTVDPPVKAARDSVTVQVVIEPETTKLGEQETLETAGSGGVTVTLAVCEAPFTVAVTVAV